MSNRNPCVSSLLLLSPDVAAVVGVFWWMLPLRSAVVVGFDHVGVDVEQTIFELWM